VRQPLGGRAQLQRSLAHAALRDLGVKTRDAALFLALLQEFFGAERAHELGRRQRLHHDLRLAPLRREFRGGGMRDSPARGQDSARVERGQGQDCRAHAQIVREHERAITEQEQAVEQRDHAAQHGVAHGALCLHALHKVAGRAQLEEGERECQEPLGERGRELDVGSKVEAPQHGIAHADRDYRSQRAGPHRDQQRP
jgi:hypothetical protein